MSVKLPPLVDAATSRASRPIEPGKPLEELERELGDAWPPEGAIKLASNENPLGPSPRALEAAQRGAGRRAPLSRRRRVPRCARSWRRSSACRRAA